jgi:UDP-glucose 4-epimerase
MMTLEDAVDLVMYAFENGNQGDLFVQKAPAATIDVLAKAVLELKKCDLAPVYIGTRHGEKLYEVLVTQEEMTKAVDLGDFYKIPADNRNLNYDRFIEKGSKELILSESYHSHNTARLDVSGMKKLLVKLDLFK